MNHQNWLVVLGYEMAKWQMLTYEPALEVEPQPESKRGWHMQEDWPSPHYYSPTHFHHFGWCGRFNWRDSKKSVVVQRSVINRSRKFFCKRDRVRGEGGAHPFNSGKIHKFFKNFLISQIVLNFLIYISRFSRLYIWRRWERGIGIGWLLLDPRMKGVPETLIRLNLSSLKLVSLSRNKNNSTIFKFSYKNEKLPVKSDKKIHPPTKKVNSPLFFFCKTMYWKYLSVRLQKSKK